MQSLDFTVWTDRNQSTNRLKKASELRLADCPAVNTLAHRVGGNGAGCERVR